MSEKRRRKSLTILRPPMAPLTPINEPSGPSSPASFLRKQRPHGLASPSSAVPSPTSSEYSSTSPSTPTDLKPKSSMDRLVQRARPKSLQKSGRPSSLFGSRRGLPNHDEDEATLTRTTSHPSSVHSQSDYLSNLTTSQVLLHGDVQTACGMFRKRSQYLVLTDTHLIKFRTQTRASELFPTIPPSIGRASGIRHSRLSSSGSVHDLHTQNETLQSIPLNQMVAIYRLDDGKPYFSIEIFHLDEDSVQESSTILQLHDPRDHDLWLSSVRGAALNARLKDPMPFSQQLVEYTARVLEQDRDYDPHQFHMFRVVQRATKSGVGARSSSDDLTKLTSKICILAIGVFKLHLVPLPRNHKTLSSTSLTDLGGISHGLAALSAFTVAQDDDSFFLRFRLPLRSGISLSIASSYVNDIALSARRTADYLRPKWPEQPFTWNVPKVMDEDFLPIPPIDEDHEALNRTLSAYCAAYNLDASLIRYTVFADVEDGPAFCLEARADGRKYNVLELLAVLRSLRYNESFGTLSFAGVLLDELQRLRDPYGSEHVAWRIRFGEPLDQEEQSNFTLLVQEVRALALNSTSLRRLDFSDCLSSTTTSALRKGEDQGCGTCEALFPMCVKQATNIDWVILAGINLSETDMDYFYSAVIDRSCHFRAIETGRCGLSDRSMHTVLHALSHQNATLESLDLSGNPARMEPDWMLNLEHCSFLRKLNLSNLTRASSMEPLIPTGVLSQWRLEELYFSGTSLNNESFMAIAEYLSSPESFSLKILDLENCNLHGHQATGLLRSSVEQYQGTREMRVTLSGNRLERGHDLFAEIIRNNQCPSQIIMQMIEYQDENNFRQLLEAVTFNQTINYLDLSRISLPSEAGVSTCGLLGRLLTTNKTLLWLDISGEQTHLVASVLGAGLNSALNGLKHNTALQVLRIENQRLGLQGASMLASVIEENQSLREIHCEGNEINLQAFTVLVNSVERNTSLLYLPDMTSDRLWAQKKVSREVDSLQENSASGITSISSTKATVKRTLGKTMTGQRSGHSRISSGTQPALDVHDVVSSLSAQWDKEVARLRGYLARNYERTHDISVGAPGTLDFGRPATSSSLETAMRDFSLDQTPRAEVDRQLGHEVEEPDGRVQTDESGDEGDEGDSPLEMKTG